MNKKELMTQLQSKCIESGSSYAKKREKKYLSKKYNHINNKKIQDFYCSMDAKYSDRLFEVKFKKSFSFYLFLYLKEDYESTYGITNYDFSSPVDVNFTLISELADVGRNTVKRAYQELIDLGMVTPYVNNKLKSRAQNMCIVLNDSYLDEYDNKNHKVNYSF